MPSQRPKTPDWLLERIALGELPEAELALRKAALLAEPDGAARLAALEASNRQILDDYPPEHEAARIRGKVTPMPRPAPARRWWGVVALAPALAVALVYALQPDAEYVGVKGEPRLVVYRRTASGSERLGAGAKVHAGELLQLSYIAAGRTHGAIVSIDGRGGVTLHWPKGAGDDGLLTQGGPQGGEVALDHAIELDAAPRFERFFLVTNQQALDVQALLRAAGELAADAQQATSRPLGLPAGVEQTSLLLFKDSREDDLK